MNAAGSNIFRHFAPAAALLAAVVWWGGDLRIVHAVELMDGAILPAGKVLNPEHPLGTRSPMGYRYRWVKPYWWFEQKNSGGNWQPISYGKIYWDYRLGKDRYYVKGRNLERRIPVLPNGPGVPVIFEGPNGGTGSGSSGGNTGTSPARVVSAPPPRVVIDLNGLWWSNRGSVHLVQQNNHITGTGTSANGQRIALSGQLQGQTLHFQWSGHNFAGGGNGVLQLSFDQRRLNGILYDAWGRPGPYVLNR